MYLYDVGNAYELEKGIIHTILRKLTRLADCQGYMRKYILPSVNSAQSLGKRL